MYMYLCNYAVSLFQKPERDESFQVDLGECDGGAELGKIKKTIITIVNDEGMYNYSYPFDTVQYVAFMCVMFSEPGQVYTFLQLQTYQYSLLSQNSTVW